MYLHLPTAGRWKEKKKVRHNMTVSSTQVNKGERWLWQGDGVQIGCVSCLQCSWTGFTGAHPFKKMWRLVSWSLSSWWLQATTKFGMKWGTRRASATLHPPSVCKILASQILNNTMLPALCPVHRWTAWENDETLTIDVWETLLLHCEILWMSLWFDLLDRWGTGINDMKANVVFFDMTLLL